MSYINKQNQVRFLVKHKHKTLKYKQKNWQEDNSGQLARKLLKIATISGRKVVLRHAAPLSDTVTEVLHEFGTTDVAIGDVATEVMITTLGKIPSEMYYLEDTNANVPAQIIKIQETSPLAHAVMATTEAVENNNESSHHSSVLIALLTALLIILLLCCITACLIAKSKRKTTFFEKSDMECEPGCTGMSQPLLDKISSSTNKSSISCLRN
ncbi:hypothetical protein WH47_12806 [Habropoda laboriosa]|uniref:Uncharacterized protein n=1 Tax=Habropoda laboriosa TaxID=597456 RepID=A0A0L7R549_9HYME|nr:hypothetical protein WH47_12806 [Habropoda laboriosa]